MLRKVKFLALTAMFWVALSANDQVTTSALSGVVAHEKPSTMNGNPITVSITPSETMTNDVPQPKVRSRDGNFAVYFIGFLGLIIIAILKDKDVKIASSGFSMELFSNKEKKSKKTNLKKKNKKE